MKKPKMIEALATKTGLTKTECEKVYMLLLNCLKLS